MYIYIYIYIYTHTHIYIYMYVCINISNIRKYLWKLTKSLSDHMPQSGGIT